MKNFLKGIIFGSIGLAAIQNIVEILNGAGDYVTSKIAVKSLDLQKAATQKTKEIEKISNECDCEAVNTQCIGFAVPAEEEYDEDYIEEDKSKRRHR
jgi:hypothetical protein